MARKDRFHPEKAECGWEGAEAWLMTCRPILRKITRITNDHFNSHALAAGSHALAAGAPPGLKPVSLKSLSRGAEAPLFHGCLGGLVVVSAVLWLSPRPSLGCARTLPRLSLRSSMPRYGVKHASVCSRGGRMRPHLPTHREWMSSFQQVPGFAVLFVFRVGGVRGEEDVGLVVGGANGEDVPGVRRDDVGGDEVDVAGGVGDSVGVEVTFVGVATVEDGAFDLDAGEPGAVFGGEIVGGGVSPGLGDAEAKFRGPGHEAQFGPY